MNRIEDYVAACERYRWPLPPCGILFEPVRPFEKKSRIVGRYIDVGLKKIYECMVCGADTFISEEGLIEHCKGHRWLG